MTTSNPTTVPSTPSLSPTHLHALLDILTHNKTYAEISAFRVPGAIKTYGPPFQAPQTVSTTSPVLQKLLEKFVLTLPGLRDVSESFWKERVEDLIQELSEAELSESYDKGVLGIRKTLATAISALIEYPARGVLFGLEEKECEGKSGEYDVEKPEDVLRAWPDALQGMVYGGLVGELFERAAETDDLTMHSGLVRGMHEFVVVNIASLLHYTLVLSPEGPTLLRMIENVHRLLPYIVVRQTLKIGNVATMISAMMKVILAKVSVGSVTNWIGLSSGADEGMNLLQQIISQVLSWEKRDLRSRADKIEKSPSAPPKAVREAIKDWVTTRTRMEHDEARRTSQASDLSIVAVILALSSGPSADDLTEQQHAAALEYLGLHLSIRDRQVIVKVLCQRNPDHLTAAIQDAVAAYTPMIRLVHEAVNLSDTVWDFERFVTDMLKMSKPSGAKGEERPPCVEDYVDLLHRHQSSSHKFLHQVAKNGKEVTSWWRGYVDHAVAQFRRENPTKSTKEDDATAHSPIESTLLTAFASLPNKDQRTITTELTAHTTYLDALHAASAARIVAVINRTRSTPFGPGAYLARWQRLLDETPITPASAHGAVRHGGSREVREEGGKDGIGGEEFLADGDGLEEVGRRTPEAPKVGETIRLLGAVFGDALAEEERGG